jgi:uncharacterized protein (DUF433 family)
MVPLPSNTRQEFLGLGFYSVADAARLLRMPARNIRRWLSGYSFKQDGEYHEMPPLWTPDLPRVDDRLELSFRDLIELRFVHGFVVAGVGLLAIRNCLNYAREVVGSDRPFSTSRFRTDGRTIFLESAGDDEEKLLDLKRHQFAFKRVVERSFKDLDIEHDEVARWRPYRGKATIVVDPERAFGQPIAAKVGVPTVALAESVEAEGSAERTAAVFELPVEVVRDAVKFEQELRAA